MQGLKIRKNKQQNSKNQIDMHKNNNLKSPITLK